MKFGISGQRVAAAGRKTHFWISDRVKTIYTGMVALRAGLPVITTYAIKPEHLAHWAMAAVGHIGLKMQYKLAHVRYTPARA